MALLNSAVALATKKLPKAVTPKGHAVIDYITVGAFLVTGALYWRRHKRAALSAFIQWGSFFLFQAGRCGAFLSLPMHASTSML